MTLSVSINYPWGTAPPDRHSCGFDFGVPPEGWGFRGSDRRWHGYWMGCLAQDLDFFIRLRLRTVRFALLFNGLTYGVDGRAPIRPPASVPWAFTPGPLSSEFLADFRSLVRIFASKMQAGVPPVQLLPVLAGFDLAIDPAVTLTSKSHKLIPNPYRYPESAYSDIVAPVVIGNQTRPVHFVAGRRAQAFSGEPIDPNAAAGVSGGPSADVTYQALFLNHVVDRLLHEFRADQPLADCRPVIHSWELCAEPEMFTAPPRQRVEPRHPVANTDMLSYLSTGIDLVRSHGFQATVGFQLWQTVARWGWDTRLPPHIEQFHYYADQRDAPAANELPDVRPGRAAMIGELATHPDSPFDPNFRRDSDEQHRRSANRPISLRERLEWLEDLGYREVFLWSAAHVPPQGFHSWTAREHEQIYQFTDSRRAPRRSEPPRVQ